MYASFDCSRTYVASAYAWPGAIRYPISCRTPCWIFVKIGITGTNFSDICYCILNAKSSLAEALTTASFATR